MVLSEVAEAAKYLLNAEIKKRVPWKGSACGLYNTKTLVYFRQEKEMFTTNKIEYRKLKCQQTHASMKPIVLEFLHMDLAHSDYKT